jgi:hypothetical protein
MPRVVPSQIVGFIESNFPAAERFINETYRPAILTTLELVSQLPEELKTLSGEEYNHFVLAIHKLGALLPIRPLPSNPTGPAALKLIREALAKCPDEAPSPATAELSFIPDANLRDNIRNDINAANVALIDGLWKAATVLAGAAAEALLLWAITDKKSAPDIENARAAVIPSASRDPSGWILDGYIKVAKALVLIEDETAKQADLAREFRNLIHPGRSARLAKKCDRGTALSALAAVELIVRDLS